MTIETARLTPPHPIRFADRPLPRWGRGKKQHPLSPAHGGGGGGEGVHLLFTKHHARLQLSLLALAALLVSACTAQPNAAATRRERALAVTAAEVRRGDIQQTLSYSGDIRATGQVAVLSKASGRVERVLVDVGSRVRAGDPLAQLEHDKASIQVLQAQAGLAGAEAKLAQVLAGGRADELAAARAALQQQQIRLESMRAGGREDDVALAAAALEAAQARLDLVAKGATGDLRQAAQSAVDSDIAAVSAAEAALRNLDGASAADLQQAQGVYDVSVAQREAALAALGEAGSPTEAQVAAAVDGIARAEANLRAARSRLIELRDGRSVTAGPCARQPDGGARTSPTACTAAIDAAIAASASAERTLAAAQEQLELLESGGPPAIQARLRAQLEEAEANIRTTRARLDALAGAVESQRRQLEAQLVAARERLKTDLARLEQLADGPQEEEVRQAAAAVEQARLQVERTRSPHTAYDIQQQEQAVAQAQAALRSRQNPYAPEDVAAARAGVDQARAQLELAQLGIRDSVVAAPVDGVVAERLVAAGALVGPSTPIVTLVPPGLELVVNVDEAQLGRVAEGQPVSLQVAAFPDQSFPGQVIAIAPTVDSRSRTAAVRVEPFDPVGKLRAGMFARLSIVTATRVDALLVPREAVVSAAAGDATIIAIDEANRARKRPVQVGLVGDSAVEILGGLSEGERIVAGGAGDLSDGDLLAPQANLRAAAAR